MMTRGFLCGLSTMLIVPCGCAGITGKWTASSMEPEMARDQFRLLRPDDHEGQLVKATISLKKDSTYLAEVFYEGGADVTTGTWKLTDNKLTLLDNKYGSHTYTVELSGNRKVLRIIRPIKGTDVALVMTRD
ncbi:MAG: lipocalin family protein [Phycisphaerales bacterium]|nr:MAG: lipocalin family protein [Phycisphaerales bacterium]